MKIQIFRGARKYIPPDYACIFAGEIFTPWDRGQRDTRCHFQKKRP